MKRRTNQRSHRGQSTRNRRGSSIPFRLLLEPLESRRLLAGIQVSVYLDQDNSRNFDPTSDAPAPNRLVYVDLNHNGTFEHLEPVSVTDAAGIAFFGNLEPGEHSIGLLTNARTQPQVDPVNVAQPTLLFSDSWESLLASNDLAYVWAVDGSGRAKLVTASSDDAPTIELGGRVLSSVARSQDSVWAVVPGAAAPRLLEIDLPTGEHREVTISGLPAATEIVSLAQAASHTTALMDGPGGTVLGLVTERLGESGSQRYATIELSSVSAQAMAASENSDWVVAVSLVEGSQSTITLLDPRSGFEEVSSIIIDGRAEAITFSADGQLALVTLSGGGVVVLSAGTETLALAASLDEAAGPVVANSADGRLVTGSSRNARELIVWDRALWLPVGRSTLPALSPPEEFTSVVADRQGDQLLVLNGGDLHHIDMARPNTAFVNLQDAQDLAEIRLGVRTQALNTAPDVSGFAARTVSEDTPDEIDFASSAGIVDAEGDMLWFALAEPARHGTLELTPDGNWNYQPQADYNGLDSALLVVHDGQTATELLVQWEITPVNDAPISMSVDVPEIPENSLTDTQIGFVSIVDADRDASYRVTTSDPRFVVENGRIFLVGEDLDFESEDAISVRFLATDVSDPSISISTIATLKVRNVNEAPTAIRLPSQTVSEHDAGATVGRIEVVDPDADSQYDFLVSDTRFMVADGELRLAPDVVLDFEVEPTIELTISAVDRSEGGYRIEEHFTLSVVNQNDPPRGIVLSGLEIEEHLAGAPVGSIYVDDPDNDFYHYAVSDDRFDVIDGQLRLAGSNEVDWEVESQITLTVTATALNGDAIAATFTIAVIPKSASHQNPRNPNDVNNDGIVTPLDILIIINDLNENGSHPLSPVGEAGTGETPATMPDVNGDGMVTPLDALLILNELNNVVSYEGGGEGESASETAWGFSTPEYEAQRRRQESKIDQELDLLLEQLSQERLR